MENIPTNQQPQPTESHQEIPPMHENKMSNFPIILLVSVSVISVVSLGIVLLMRMTSSQPTATKNPVFTQTVTSQNAPSPSANQTQMTSGNEVQDTLSTQVSDFDSDFTPIEKDLSSL